MSFWVRFLEASTSALVSRVAVGLTAVSPDVVSGLSGLVGVTGVVGVVGVDGADEVVVVVAAAGDVEISMTLPEVVLLASCGRLLLAWLAQTLFFGDSFEQSHGPRMNDQSENLQLAVAGSAGDVGLDCCCEAVAIAGAELELGLASGTSGHDGQDDFGAEIYCLHCRTLYFFDKNIRDKLTCLYIIHF